MFITKITELNIKIFFKIDLQLQLELDFNKNFMPFCFGFEKKYKNKISYKG